ncbi:ABC transporter ATP-binding protein [Luedemannella flava]|uniref:ABC transporter ATP-binding protein n=1 Tax=Luedemannella flava TaxID=349316 RepID=A0ABP4YEX9_9ACTN
MTDTPHPAVALNGLTKRYGGRTAVDRLTMHVPVGVVAGFVGPNGAGKTTAMSMLLGLIRPSAGTAEVLGEPISRPGAYLRRVGALVEGPGFYPALTGAANLRVLATIGGHDPARIPTVLAEVGLAARGDDRYGRYSLGMKQRLGIAATLLGDPELVILDEPTNGLDPAGMAEMRQIIAAIAAQGRTILVSSHLLGEVEQVCDWLIIINRGTLAYQGPTAQFAARAGARLVALAADHAEAARLADLLTTAGHTVDRAGDEVAVDLDGRDAPSLGAHVNRFAHDRGIVLAGLREQRPSLEDQVLALIGGAG